MVARRSAVKARTAAQIQIKTLLITAPGGTGGNDDRGGGLESDPHRVCEPGLMPPGFWAYDLDVNGAGEP